MLIIFKSAACSDLITFEKDARQMLDVLGKDSNDGQGIVTVEQLPAAIRQLRQAIDEDVTVCAAKGSKMPLSTADEGSDEDGDAVSFHQHAVPLLELLECSLKDQVPVTWGV